MYCSGGLFERGAYSRVGLYLAAAWPVCLKCRYIRIYILLSKNVSAHGGFFEGGGLFHKKYLRVRAYSRGFSFEGAYSNYYDLLT